MAFEKTSSEAAENRMALEIAQQKDAKSTSTISELSSLVREQKARLAELSRAKSDQVAEMKERIQQLEGHLDEARRRMIQFEMLKKEHAKLQADLHAQESLVAGLREEKKVWGDELAQQGATLAQDRGRLESRVESLQAEISELRRKSERDQDALRIKAKVCVLYCVLVLQCIVLTRRCSTLRTLRSSDTLLLTMSFIRTELAKRAFRCAAPSVWNSLPSFITNSSSLTTYKFQRLETYFFRLSFDCSVHV